MQTGHWIAAISIGVALGIGINELIAYSKKNKTNPTENKNNLPENENTPENQATADWVKDHPNK